MGTRHLVCVARDGEYKVAQYGQWDGYPSGAGMGCLEFLRHKIMRATFESKLKNYVRFATEKEIKKQWKECGADESGWVSMDVADKYKKLYPENSRDTGYEVLSIILSADKELLLQNDIDFVRDSLFCEWAYVIDLDKNTFEVYKGFNKEPLGEYERFFKFQDEGILEYYPVRFKASYDIDHLPSDEEFLSLEKEEEE